MDSMPRLVVLRVVNGVVVDPLLASDVRFPVWAASLEPTPPHRSDGDVCCGPLRRVGVGG